MAGGGPAVTAEIFEGSAIRAVYQPIVDLADGQVVAVEALARWPELSVTPDAAFDMARHAGRLAELNTLCQRAALQGVGSVPLPDEFAVLVNVEPGQPIAALEERTGGPRVMAEITERALLDDPAELLRSIRKLRDSGCGIALDDVGVVRDSLALLPFVAPDVIKLDISLVQRWPDADQARILTAVAAYAERSGAAIVAEGVETESQYHQALAVGATYGQGWRFARPGPLLSYPAPRRPIPFMPAPATTASTPFEFLEPRQTRVGSKGMLLSISRHIEQQGHNLETPPVVLGAFQTAERFTPATAGRYRHLAGRCPLVVALGAGMPSHPAPGVRGASLDLHDRLRGEWTVVVVGPHYTGALIAEDLGDQGPELDRRFRFAVTHRPDTVLAAAKALLGRIDPR